jgi:hypothetical protein
MSFMSILPGRIAADQRLGPGFDIDHDISRVGDDLVEVVVHGLLPGVRLALGHLGRERDVALAIELCSEPEQALVHDGQRPVDVRLVAGQLQLLLDPGRRRRSRATAAGKP